MVFSASKLRMPTPAEALPGRTTPMPVPDRHFVNGAPLVGPFPGLKTALFGLGCFWGAEKGVLAGARRGLDGGGLRRRAHAECDLS